MLDTKLILIDGMTGAGKSTTAQRLWLHLERCGLAARWFYEHDTSGPIWRPGEQEKLLASGVVAIDFVVETLPLRWRRLAEECLARATWTILDGTLFQSTVGFLLAMSVDEHAIRSNILATDRAIAELKPVLVYFRPRDVTQALQAAFEDRRADGYEAMLIAHLARTPYGRQCGLRDVAGLVRYFERWQELVESLCTQVGMRKLVIEAADWSTREKQLTDFLGLPEIIQPKMRIEKPARLVGRFQDTASTDQLVVAVDEHGLYLDDARRTRLIPRPDGTFLVAPMCVELAFDVELGGRFQRLQLRGNLPGLSPVWMRTEAE